MKVYICGTDLLYFRPDADVECTMYATLEAAKARLPCADECGVVEVDLGDLKRWVVPEKPVSEWSNEARVYRATEIRPQLSFFFCPPNRGENATRKPKHGVKKKRKER